MEHEQDALEKLGYEHLFGEKYAKGTIIIVLFSNGGFKYDSSKRGTKSIPLTEEEENACAEVIKEKEKSKLEGFGFKEEKRPYKEEGRWFRQHDNLAILLGKGCILSGNFSKEELLAIADEIKEENIK